jgi:preprotein translocase subunit SecA
MFKKFLIKLTGDPNEKELKRLWPIVEQIRALEPEMQALSDDGLRALTEGFRQHFRDDSADDQKALAALQEEIDREQDDEERRALRRKVDALKAEMDRRQTALLAEILPRAFAAVREAAVRAIGMRHFDEQMIGGLVLHQNKIAEMKTGEGKTLVATLPLYLNALTGRGVHLVTPNDYLSKIGVQWMGPVYHLLGLSVAVIQSMGQDPSMASFYYNPDYISADDRYQHLRPCERPLAYQADVLYGTNNEFGFDYLRDNMVLDLSQCVQRELYYAIVDEVDNILVDEARTPLIISGPAEESTSHYQTFARLVAGLRPETHYTVEEKERGVNATEEGINAVERALNIDNLYAPENFELTPYLENALRAKALYQRDRDYIVRDGEVIIVDDFTGRLMYGRRYSEGLHQAIEAKENVKVQRESLTLATITFQNFFRMYRRLAGMTGTAATEAEEFGQIYDLEVVVIPTHMPVVRVDDPDLVYKNGKAKFDAVIEEIVRCHEAGQPTLVGTLAIETSEMISERLKRRRVPHEVLNAKYHEREAQIIAQAGRPGAVTIATNMAGRGVDILLGGNAEGLARDELRRSGSDLQELDPTVWAETLARYQAEVLADRQRVLAAGGLRVVGTERYEARRIDNQLRGRSGRQGDPGSSLFFVGLDDDLMRRFGGEAVAGIMDRLGVEENIPIEHSMVTRAIANAQIRVEGHNFDLRKHVLEYDDVVNQQRQVIYDQRRLVLSEPNLKPIVLDILSRQLEGLVASYTAAQDEEEWDLKALHALVDRIIHLPPALSVATWSTMSVEQIKDQVVELAAQAYEAHELQMGSEIMRQAERVIMLRSIDNRWIHHLTALDQLREGIGLRAFAQRNPLVEYKREAFDAFDELMATIQADVAGMILNTRLERQPATQKRPLNYSGASGGSAGSQHEAVKKNKIGRNDPCPCGSGKKFKQCCMREKLTPEEAAAKARK